jgi:hypothetical protein
MRTRINKINWDASLPVLGINIIDNAHFEYGMIGLAFLIGSGALWHGFHKHHHRSGPWRFFAAGMILLLAKQIGHSYQFLILPFAVALILIAHGWNYRLCRGASETNTGAGGRLEAGGAGRQNSRF